MSRQMVDDRSVCIRAAYLRFTQGQPQQCLDAVREALDEEGFVEPTSIEVASILAAMKTPGQLPGDELPEAPGQVQEPVPAVPADPEDDDLGDLLVGRGCVDRCG